jgi:hypothetical protein
LAAYQEGVMSDKPRSPDSIPTEFAVRFASQTRDLIRSKEIEDDDEMLKLFTMRMSIRTHRMLYQAARRHSTTMTQIILSAIEPILPILLELTPEI